MKHLLWVVGLLGSVLGARADASQGWLLDQQVLRFGGIERLLTLAEGQEAAPLPPPLPPPMPPPKPTPADASDPREMSTGVGKIVGGSLLCLGGLGFGSLAILFGASAGSASFGSGYVALAIVFGAAALVMIGGGAALIAVGFSQNATRDQAVQHYREQYGENWEETAPRPDRPPGRPGLGKIITGSVLSGIGLFLGVDGLVGGGYTTSSPLLLYSVAGGVLLCIGLPILAIGLTEASAPSAPSQTAAPSAAITPSIGWNPVSRTASLGFAGRF